MGASGTKELPPLGPDSVQTPSWASRLDGSCPVVYFDIAIDDQPVGRIEMTLASNIVRAADHLLCSYAIGTSHC